MNMFSIITIIIVSISMIVIGYVAPYVTLAFYAIQRKTTIKSLQSLVNKYDSLFDIDAFDLPKFLGYSMAVFSPVLTLQIIKDAPSYTEVMAGLALCLISVLGFSAVMSSSDVQLAIEYADDCLREQSIKI